MGFWVSFFSQTIDMNIVFYDEVFENMSDQRFSMDDQVLDVNELFVFQ